MGDINTEVSSSCHDHLYGKAARNFDEGSCTGLLMQNALTGDQGRKIRLHNRPCQYKGYDEGSVNEQEMSVLYGKSL